VRFYCLAQMTPRGRYLWQLRCPSGRSGRFRPSGLSSCAARARDINLRAGKRAVILCTVFLYLRCIALRLLLLLLGRLRRRCALYCLHAATSASAASKVPRSRVFLDAAELSLYGSTNSFGMGRQRRPSGFHSGLAPLHLPHCEFQPELSQMPPM
jgi:hypothetical protein